MHYVYLLQHELSGDLYIGTTDDPKRRLGQHNAKGKKFSTRPDGKWEYIYLEIYRSKNDALSREKKLKAHANGKQQLLKRLRNSLLSPKLVRDQKVNTKYE